MLKLLNPFYVFETLKENEQSLLLLVMIAPAIDGAIYDRFSLVFAALSLLAFFKIVFLVTEK